MATWAQVTAKPAAKPIVTPTNTITAVKPLPKREHVFVLTIMVQSFCEPVYLKFGLAKFPSPEHVKQLVTEFLDRWKNDEKTMYFYSDWKNINFANFEPFDSSKTQSTRTCDRRRGYSRLTLDKFEIIGRDTTSKLEMFWVLTFRLNSKSVPYDKRVCWSGAFSEIPSPVQVKEIIQEFLEKWKDYEWMKIYRHEWNRIIEGLEPFSSISSQITIGKGGAIMDLERMDLESQ